MNTKPTQFKQTMIEPQSQELTDLIEVREGRLILKAPMETSNFISGIRGVRIQQEGLDSSGGVIEGATIESGTLTDFTNAQHDHANAAGGGQIASAAITGQIAVPKGGTGAATLTGILLGNGTSAVTAIVPLAGTKVYYVSDSSGGAVNRKLTFQDGILVAET
jgi:hypothetical protein